MFRLKRILILAAVFLLTTHFGMSFSSSEDVSGMVRDGYRILSLESGKEFQTFSVYRGDYIKFELPDSLDPAEADFPTLGQKKKIFGDPDKSPYFKMKVTGTHPFTIGKLHGRIRVLEYTQASYEALSAIEADRYIKEHAPFILDVRTPREYRMGRLENSTLIPLQELQRRIIEIDKYKNHPVLVYCATGNRSTTASKILIDEGFSKVINLRHGIVDWARKQLPITK